MDLIKAEEFLQNHQTISHFYDDNSCNMVCFDRDVKKAMIEFAKQSVINELKRHIVHPNKPGYRRKDILLRIKELENDKKD